MEILFAEALNCCVFRVEANADDGAGVDFTLPRSQAHQAKGSGQRKSERIVMARISVLMNVYNVAPYIAEALGSIQSQTFTDIEIIVADDGSTDGTRRIAEQIASTDPRITVVGTPDNRGISFALNLGLEHCSAPFIAKMDGDDIALPTRLERQLQFLQENPEIALVGCATMAIDQSGRPIPGLKVCSKPATKESVAKTMLLASPCLHLWLARREVYETLNGYREVYSEDYDFLLRAWTKGFSMSNLLDVLMQTRIRPGSASFSLEQRKAHYYSIRLFRERLMHGQDSFSREAYARAIKTAGIENRAFRLAMSCAQKAFRSRNLALRCFLTLLSAILSPWQARYFFDRIRFRVALRASMRGADCRA
jgi:glycosyltransferase involved in cell wall biosynthesis